VSLVNAAERDTQINAIMTETGFDQLVEHVPEFAQNTLKQSSGALEPKVNQPEQRPSVNPLPAPPSARMYWR